MRRATKELTVVICTNGITIFAIDIYFRLIFGVDTRLEHSNLDVTVGGSESTGDGQT